MPLLGSVPFDYRLSESADCGMPFVLEHRDTAAGHALMQIANAVSER